MKRTLFSILALFCVATLFAKGVTQQGIAYFYDYKSKTKRPIANVQLTVAYAKPTTSAADGTFTLEFGDNVKVGDKITHTKQPFYRGMKVFNMKEVDNWFVVNSRQTLIMCDYEEYELAKKNWYNLGVASVEKRHNAEIAALKKESADYYQQLSELQEKYDRIMDNMRNNADAMARIDQSELDAQMQEVYTLYEQGAVDEAMQRLEDMCLAENFLQALERKHFHEKRVEENAQDSLQLLSKLRSSVDLYKQNGQYDKAGNTLKLLADKLNTYDDIFDYAHFCVDQNMHQEAITYFQRAMELLEHQANNNKRIYLYHKSALLNNLACLYSDTQCFKKSEELFKETLDVYKMLTVRNPTSYEPYIGRTLSNLAELYCRINRLEESEAIFKEVLDLRRKLAASNPVANEPELANTMHNLAGLYSKMEKYIESEALDKEALGIRKRLSMSNPAIFEPDVASSLNSLAVLYSITHRLAESEEMFKETLEIRRRLAASNSASYEPELSETLDNLATLYKITGRYTDSEAMYIEALAIRERLAVSNPTTYERVLAYTQSNLALLYLKIQQFARSEDLLKEAVSAFRRLVVIQPDKYYPELAKALNNLAFLYSKTKRQKESEALFIEALEILRRFDDSKPNAIAYESMKATVMGDLADLFINTHRFTKSENLYKELLDIYRKLATTNSNIYSVKVASTLGNLSYNTILLKDFVKAEQLASEGLQTDSAQHWIATNLAAALLFQGKYDEAEVIYRQYKDELKDNFLSDFNTLTELGVIPKEREEEVEKIRKLLEE